MKTPLKSYQQDWENNRIATQQIETPQPSGVGRMVRTENGLMALLSEDAAKNLGRNNGQNSLSMKHNK